MARLDFLGGGLASMVLACSAANLPAQKLQNAAASMGTTSAQPELQQRDLRYMIERSDVLVLSFPLTPEMDQTVTVQPDGFINLKNGISLHVQEMTVPQLVVALKAAYSGTLNEPIINVDLKDFQRPFFSVGGQVNKPGQYELRADINVAEALEIAGGMMPTAKTQVFLLRRTANSLYKVERLNMNSILDGKKINEVPMIRPGDMVYVPEKFITNFRKYVPYQLSTGTFLSSNVP